MVAGAGGSGYGWSDTPFVIERIDERPLCLHLLFSSVEAGTQGSIVRIGLHRFPEVATHKSELLQSPVF